MSEPEGPPPSSEPKLRRGFVQGYCQSCGHHFAWHVEGTDADDMRTEALAAVARCPKCSVELHLNPAGVIQSVEVSGAAAEVQQTLDKLLDRIQSKPELAKAFEGIGQAVAEEPGLDDATRTELMQELDDLSEQAQAPADERTWGRIGVAIATISAAAAAGTRLHEAWEAWGPTIRQLMPR